MKAIINSFVILWIPFQSAAFVIVPQMCHLQTESPAAQTQNSAIRSHLFHSATNTNIEIDGNKEENGCPLNRFSVKYPRFRVPVSSTKDVPSYKAKGKSLFSGIKLSLDKSSVERKYSTEVKTGNFFWIEPEIDVSEDDERIAKGKVGVAASAAVWNVLADGIDTLKDNESKRLVVSIYDASTAGLLQLSDIINWLSDQEGHEPADLGAVRIVAEVDQEASVPTIILSITKDCTTAEVSNDVHGILTTEQVIDGTKSWVKRVLVELGICPFTKSVTKSGQGLGDFGVPVGKIAYHHSRSKLDEIPRLMSDTWDSILEMCVAGPSGKEGISSILLSAPEFDENFSLWAGPVFAILEANVSAASAEPLIGVVCFHPKYKTPNGESWPGFGHMHSLPRLRKWLNEQNKDLSTNLDDEEVAAGGAYQRRTPHATINVLRAEQLEAAEGQRSTSSLYAKNIGTLHTYGYDRLESGILNDKL